MKIKLAKLAALAVVLALAVTLFTACGGGSALNEDGKISVTEEEMNGTSDADDMIPADSQFKFFSMDDQSMSPTIETNDLIVVKPANTELFQLLQRHDIITFYGGQSSSDHITHRIIEIDRDSFDDIYFTTQGDNEADADPEPVRSEHVIGWFSFRIPQFGRLLQMQTHQFFISGSWLHIVPIVQSEDNLHYRIGLDGENFQVLREQDFVDADPKDYAYYE